MSFIKEFVQKPDGEIVINDNAKTDEFIQDKVRYFSDIQKFSDKGEILNLYKEIIDMCDFDMVNAKLDTPVSDQWLGFDKTRILEPIILLFNFSNILGAIYKELFCLDTHKLRLVTNGHNGPISTPDMLQSAVKELEDLKNGDKPAYGATLILATLLEENLKASIKASLMRDSLSEMKDRITKGTLHLNDLDKKLFSYLLNQYSSGEAVTILFDGVAASTELSYNLFRNHRIINRSDEIQNIFMNKITLNQLISSQIFKDKIDERYINVLQILFKVNKLNLRNNLAHCGFGMINYYNYNVSMLLYGVLNVALCDMCFK